MGVRIRTLVMIADIRRAKAHRAARDEAVRVVERWNKALAAGQGAHCRIMIRNDVEAGHGEAKADNLDGITSKRAHPIEKTLSLGALRPNWR
jgi:hypothetical protein